jgi:hypothetical protein
MVSGFLVVTIGNVFGRNVFGDFCWLFLNAVLLGKPVLIGQYILLPQIGWVMVSNSAKG